MSKSNQERYIFSSSLIRSNERTLLPKEALDRVLDAQDMAGAMHVLSEFGYGDGKDLASPRDFEKVLRAENRRVRDLVFSVAPDEEEIKLFLLPEDYHNIKVLLKGEFLETDPAALLVETGSIAPEKMSEMIRERNYAFMSGEMKAGVLEAVEMFSKGKDPQEIDIILDRACYQEMHRRAEETESDFIQGYVSLSIDILNINTFIRLKRIMRPWEFFKKVFLEGGNIRESVFVAAYEESYQQIADKMAPYGFRDIFAKGAETVRTQGKYSLLEKLCDDKKMDYIRDAHYVSFGVEPLIGFLQAKESEIKNLRMILTGKVASTPAQVIKERLRETYV